MKYFETSKLQVVKNIKDFQFCLYIKIKGLKLFLYQQTSDSIVANFFVLRNRCSNLKPEWKGNKHRGPKMTKKFILFALLKHVPDHNECKWFTTWSNFQFNQFPMDKINSFPTFFLVEYCVSLGNASDYGSKMGCISCWLWKNLAWLRLTSVQQWNTVGTALLTLILNYLWMHIYTSNLSN